MRRLSEKDQVLLAAHGLKKSYEEIQEEIKNAKRKNEHSNLAKAELQLISLQLGLQLKKYAVTKKQTRSTKKQDEAITLKKYVDEMIGVITDTNKSVVNCDKRLPKPHYTANSQLLKIRGEVKQIRDRVQKTELVQRKKVFAEKRIVKKDRSTATHTQKLAELLAELKVREMDYVIRISKGQEYKGFFKKALGTSATEKLVVTRELIKLTERALASNESINAVSFEYQDAKNGGLGKLVRTLQAVINEISDAARQKATISVKSAPNYLTASSSGQASIAGNDEGATTSVNCQPSSQQASRRATPIRHCDSQFFNEVERITFEELLNKIQAGEKQFSNLTVTGLVPEKVSPNAMQGVGLHNVDFTGVDNLHQDPYHGLLRQMATGWNVKFSGEAEDALRSETETVELDW